MSCGLAPNAVQPQEAEIYPGSRKILKYPFGSAAACRRFGRLRLNIVMGTVLKRRQAAALHIETVSINGILVFSNSPMQKR